jgi:hypothetical protein
LSAAITSLKAREKSLEAAIHLIHAIDELLAQTNKTIPYLLGGKLLITSPFEQKLSRETNQLLRGSMALPGYDPGLRAATEPIGPFEEANIAAIQTRMPRVGPNRQAEELGDFMKGVREDQEKLDTFRLDALKEEAKLQEHLATLAAGSDTRRAIEEVYAIRVDAVAKEYDIVRLGIGNELAGLKATEELDKARVDRVIKIAELEKHQFDEIKGKAESLFHTLFTDPKNFGKQLSNTLRNAALKPIEEGLANMTATILKPLIFGQDGQGGISGALHGMFGGQPSPIKISTDYNTVATNRNSDATEGLTRALLSSGGGGSGISSGGGGFPSLIRRFAPAALAGGLTLSALAGAPLGMGSMPGGGGVQPSATSESIHYEGEEGSTPLGGTLFPGYGPGGTAGFAGPLEGYTNTGIAEGFSLPGGGGGGGLLGGLFGGGGQQGGLAGMLAGFGKSGFGGLKDMFYNSAAADRGGLPGVPTGVFDEMGNPEYSAGTDLGTGGFSGTAQGIATSPAAKGAAFAAGMMLAQKGLMGKDRGTGKGVLEGAAGGAAIGYSTGGAMGAVVGALAGAEIGVIEWALGIESPENEAKRLIKELYGVKADDGLVNQIVALAKQKYSGNVGMAVRDPDVRKTIELYAASQGQKMPLSASTPRGGSLVQQGGGLYQEATSLYGNQYSYQSNLPVLGGGPSGSIPSPGGPTYISMNVGPDHVAGFMTGQFVTPDFVQNQFASAQNSSKGRLQNSAIINEPGLVIG